VVCLAKRKKTVSRPALRDKEVAAHAKGTIVTSLIVT